MTPLTKSNISTVFECSSQGSFPRANYFLSKTGFVGSCTILENLNKNVDYNSILSDLKFNCIWANSEVECGKIKTRTSVWWLNDILVQLSEPKRVDCSYDIILLHKANQDIRFIVDLFTPHVVKEVTEGKVFLIVKDSYGSLELISFDARVDENIDLNLNYGQEFTHKIEMLVEHLNSPTIKGLSLLHGDVGTGKSTALKLLTKKLKSKKVIFVPPFMVDSLSDPSFLPFLIEHKSSVLIIEDAEKALMSRDTGEGSSSAVSTILNMSEGILADALDIHVICTFNTARKNIDKALLRPGRLVIEHCFTSLEVHESTNLLKHLYPSKDYVASKGMTLAEIYNFEKEKLVSKPKHNSIGFNNR